MENKKLENLKLNEVLTIARSNGFVDLLKIIKDQMIDGFVIQVIDDEAIETLFPQYGLRVKFKALVKIIKKSLDEQNESTITENINDQHRTQYHNQETFNEPLTTSPTALIDLSTNGGCKKFPVPFVFPEHRLDKIVKQNLQNESYVPKDSDIKSIIDCVFKEMLEYLSDDCPYPNSSQYMLAATSIIAKYPNLRTKETDGYEYYRSRIKTKFHELRRSAIPSPNIVAARMKYTSRAKRLRSKPFAVNGRDKSNDNDDDAENFSLKSDLHCLVSAVSQHSNEEIQDFQDESNEQIQQHLLH